MARISVLGISGGVSTPSRTTAVVSALVKAVASRVPSDAGLIEITEAAPSIFAGLSRGALGASGEAIIQRVEKADLLVVGTPVYRASYTGALKHLFDLVDYIPAHNKRFAVKPEQEGSAFVAIPGVDLGEILCIQEERQVGNDNCVSFNRLKLQIPESPLRPHFVKATVKVRRYHDGAYAIFHGPRCLGRYDHNGIAVQTQKAA
ncbi:NAD(P)H-dependent oxidoreductase [Mesorhizobium sp. M0293]|uniref:NAD(P)H-dependent oxidoreductase n=1 Tax=Mesorhizobium sp. M0293 TaxID=2956930 RepID=UPI00333B4BF5